MSAEELQRAADNHCKLLEAAAPKSDSPLSPDDCAVIDCPCRKQLRRALIETVNVLDDTRRAFKSRKLAALRHKLMQILAEQE